MSSFDTIYFECPHCGEQIIKQIISNESSDRRYHFTSVPVGVAESLNNTVLVCQNCFEEYYIGIPTPRVCLLLTPKNPPDELIFD